MAMKIEVPIAVGSGRLDHPSGVFRLERRTYGDDLTRPNRYQALLTELDLVDGDVGVAVDIRTMFSAARYCLTMDEAELLATWLTRHVVARKTRSEPSP